MQLSLLFAALFSLLFSLAEAQYKVTNPTSDKTWQANTPYNVNWRATAGKQLSDFGQFTVSLYGGAKSNRTLLTTFGTVEATTQAMAINIPANLGPSGEFYFFHLRSSVTGKALLSNKFALSGMTGQFNSSMLAVINAGSRSSNSSSVSLSVATPSGAARQAGATTAAAAGTSGARYTLSFTSGAFAVPVALLAGWSALAL